METLGKLHNYSTDVNGFKLVAQTLKRGEESNMGTGIKLRGDPMRTVYIEERHLVRSTCLSTSKVKLLDASFFSVSP